MLIATIVACGYLYSPPAYWDTVKLPPEALVIERPLIEVREICPHAAKEGQQLFGCTLFSEHVAFVPTFKTFPGTYACWLEVKRHEMAHLKGWTHP